MKYNIDYLCKAFAFYKIRKYDIRGMQPRLTAEFATRN